MTIIFNGVAYDNIDTLNGVAYDKRYHAKNIWFNRPAIIVFTNVLPEFTLMSADRWATWDIESEFDLATSILYVRTV